MDLQGAFLQLLPVKCFHKPPKHGSLAELGMGAKSAAEAACNTG